MSGAPRPDRPTRLDVLRKTFKRARTRGPGEVLGLWRDRVKENVASEDELIFLARAAVWSGGVRHDPGLALEVATPADGPQFERDIGTDSATTFARRLTSATRCWLVRSEDRILHSTWTTTGAVWTRELRRYFVPPEGSAYIYESFTRADARGRGVYPFALVAIGARLHDEDIDELLVGVEEDNVPSVRAITKAGFEPAFTLAYRRRFGVLSLDAAKGPRSGLAELCLRRSAAR